MILSDAQPAVGHDVGHFSDRPCFVKPEVADDDISLVDQNPCADLQGLGVQPGVDVGVIVSPADRNMGYVLLRTAKVRADTICGSGDFLDHLVHLLDGLARFLNRHLLIVHRASQAHQVETRGIAFRRHRQQTIHQIQRRTFVRIPCPKAEACILLWVPFVFLMITHVAQTP